MAQLLRISNPQKISFAIPVGFADHLRSEFDLFKKLSANDNIMAVVSMMERPAHDYGLESLLSMDGIIFVIERGHWIKIEARPVDSNQHVPHGVRYSLTLHDRNMHRLVGYDNAHAVNAQKRRFAPKRAEWDHRHRLHEVFEYRFESAEKLLIDFWNEVYELLFEVDRKK